MRNAFAKTILALAEQDPRIVLLSGDIGNRMFDGFKAAYPDRFYNCGVAEANMISMAAGLAMAGMRPVAYTIAPFITTRALEQIKVDLCYHQQPVVIAGVGGGLSYANLGPTHYSLTDIAQLRSLPEMTVVCPGDAVEVRLALTQAVACAGPVYLRLGKKGEPVIHQTDPDFQIGKGLCFDRPAEGGVCLLNTGNLLPVAVAAAEQLTQHDIPATVVSMHTVKPLDTALLADCFARSAVVATLEEHVLAGGFGSAVAEWVCEQPKINAKLVRFGAPDHYPHEAGDQAYVRRCFGLTADDIARVLQDTWTRQPRHAIRQKAS